MARLRLLACSAVLALVARASEWTPHVVTETAWSDNASNANRASDRIGALQLTADLATSRRIALTEKTALLPAGHIAVEEWPAHHPLSRFSVGLQLECRYKPGLGPYASIVAASASLDGVVGRESMRSGGAGNIQLAWRKRVGAARLEFAETMRRSDTRERTFSGTSYETSARLACDVGDAIELSFTAFGRAGDIVSYATPPRPELVALAGSRVNVATFGRPMVAYTFRAATFGGTAAIGFRVGASTHVALNGTYSETSRAALRYRNPLVSVAIVHQL